MATTVHVKGISAQTTETEVRDFFSFCGKIQSLSITPDTGDTQSASVSFEKETAAKTALLLDNTQLGPASVKVTGDPALGSDSSRGTTGTNDGGEQLAQEDKPRARVAAEMLAHGYVLGDSAIQRALALDQQHGISTRFTTALQQFDEKYKATERAQAVDQKYGLSTHALEGWKGLNSYFEKAIGTPTGQRLLSFYEQGQKQVLDVHTEAQRLAALKQGKSGSSTDSAAAPGSAKAAEAATEKPSEPTQ